MRHLGLIVVVQFHCCENIKGICLEYSMIPISLGPKYPDIDFCQIKDKSFIKNINKKTKQKQKVAFIFISVALI